MKKNENRDLNWSVSIRDADSGTTLFNHNAAKVLKTASIGKLALLGYVGAKIISDSSLASELLRRSSVDPVGDSGMWQHLRTESLSVADAATLVFATSDNLATNVLLHRFGLDNVDRFRSQLGLIDTVLFDQIRDERGPHHPEVLSKSSASELSAFMASIWRKETLNNPKFCMWFMKGLSLSADLSMVGAPLGLDPLAHPGPDDDLGFANKTGTDIGIRGDTGILSVGGRHYAYACIVNYEGGIVNDREALATMQRVGQGMVQDNLDAFLHI